MMKILLAIAVSILDPPKAHKILTIKGKDQRAETDLGFGLFVLCVSSMSLRICIHIHSIQSIS